MESFIKYYNTSFIRKIINTIDVKEDSALLKSAKESYILQKLNNFFEFSQNIFSTLTENSAFVKNLDAIILFFIAVLMVSIIVAPTGIIGLLAFLCFILSFVKICLRKGEKFTLNSLDTAIFLYIAIAGLSVTFSYIPLAALKGLAKMIVYFAAYLTFYNIIKNHPKRTLYLLGTLAAVASIEAFYAIYQQIHGVDALASWQDLSRTNPEQMMNRVYGTLQPLNPNLLAGYLIATFSSAAGMFFWFLNKKSVRLTVLSGIGTFAIMLAIVFTGSRGAYISLAGMTVLIVAISGHIIWRDYSNNKLLKNIWIGFVAAGIFAALLAIIASPALQHRIASIFASRADSSNSFRMNVWISTLKMFADNWLIGIGPGNTVFRLTYGFYMVTGFDALGAYCVPLEIAAESGIFALLAFAWMLLMIGIKGIKTIISNTPTEHKIILASCMVGVIGIMLHGTVDTVFYRPQINTVFWMLVAIFAANVPAYNK